MYNQNCRKDTMSL